MPQRDNDPRWTEDDHSSVDDKPERKVAMLIEPPQIIKGNNRFQQGNYVLVCSPFSLNNDCFNAINKFQGLFSNRLR